MMAISAAPQSRFLMMRGCIFFLNFDVIMRQFFKKDTDLSIIIESNFRLLKVLDYIGVDLQYCGLPVEEACEKSGVDCTGTLMICNSQTFASYTPSDEELKKGDIREVMRLLHNSHVYYNSDAFVRLEEKVSELMNSFLPSQREVVDKFVSDYRRELERHFDYEEEVVYPYILSLLEGRRDREYSAEEYAARHDNAVEKLCDLKHLMMCSLHGKCDNSLRADVLLLIYHIEEDLEMHTKVENDVLLPMIRMIESHEERK